MLALAAGVGGQPVEGELLAGHLPVEPRAVVPVEVVPRIRLEARGAAQVARPVAPLARELEDLRLHRLALDLLDLVHVARRVLALGRLRSVRPRARDQLVPIPVVHLRAAAHAQHVPIPQVGDHLLDLLVREPEERLVLGGDARTPPGQSTEHLHVLDLVVQRVRHPFSGAFPWVVEADGIVDDGGEDPGMLREATARHVVGLHNL